MGAKKKKKDEDDDDDDLDDDADDARPFFRGSQYRFVICFSIVNLEVDPLRTNKCSGAF